MNTTASAGHSGINHPSKQQLPLYTVPARCVPHKSLVAAGAACPRCPLVWAAHSHALVSRTCAAPARQLQHGSNELGLTRRTCQPLATLALAMIVSLQQVLAVGPAQGAELQESSSSIQGEGSVPSELSAAGEQQGPRLSALMQGSTKRQVEGCTRRCVPTCIRGGQGAPGLGPISMRREIVVFKDGFRSRQYCLSECAQVCYLQQQQQQPEQQPSQQQQQQQPVPPQVDQQP